MEMSALSHPYSPSMIYNISVRSAASEQLQQAYEWYESQQTGLGVSFLDAVHQVLDLIQQQPSVYRIRYGTNVRGALVGNFPYLVYYRTDEHTVNILAVFNTRQDPERLEL